MFKQCFIHVQFSCHFVVLLVSNFRDKYFHLFVPLHLTSSDRCEILFFKIGDMVGLERAYDFHELVGSTNMLNRLAGIEYGKNELQFDCVHNKMENMWTKLHPLEDSETLCDLGD